MPVYFLQPADGGPIKIGHSDDVDTRHRTLESHYGRPLVLLGTRPGGRGEESAIHRRFAHLRIGRTEQFRPADELMEFIGRPLLIGSNPDTIEAMGPATSPNALSIRGSSAWRDWLTEYAESRRTTPTGLIDQALAMLAKADKFKAPPPRI